MEISDHVFKQYMARWKEVKCDAILTQEEQCGRPQKTSRHAVNIIKQDLEKCPPISAQQIKESNNLVFGELSVKLA